jgi:hypothetical protein
MKKQIAILFLITMLVQAIPVLHFFTEKPEIFYAVLDEEKPSEKKETKGDKEQKKEFLSLSATSPVELMVPVHFQNHASQLPFSPHLKLPTPPPDFC